MFRAKAIFTFSLLLLREARRKILSGGIETLNRFSPVLFFLADKMIFTQKGFTDDRRALIFI